MTLKETIQALIKDQIKIQTIAGKVISVNETEMTCDLDLKTAPDMLDVRLRSIIDETKKGILIIPKVGSYVLASIIDNRKESAYVSCFSDIDKIRILTDEIELSGDTFGGIVKSEIVASEINDLKADINSLKQILTTWVPVLQDGGTALKTAVTGWAGQTLVNVVKTDLENDKVKHG